MYNIHKKKDSPKKLDEIGQGFEAVLIAIRNEGKKTEQELTEMVLHEDIPKNLLTYASKDLVLLSNNSLTIVTNSLRESHKNEKLELGKVSLTWKPDFIDLALSDDLGYIYGNYIYTKTD